MGLCQGRYGRRAIGPYIISMCQGADDALGLLVLARVAGLVGDDGGVPLDIAPLFETVPDLDNAPHCMATLLEDPLYRAHLKARGDVQVVMLGYSDSNKESGLAASRWALQEAQVALVALARRHEVRLVLFHGRGGTASRGGSKPRAAILAEPKDAVQGRLRITEQGEIIHAKYGLRDIALRTLELMGGAVLEASGGERPAQPAEFAEVMRCIASESRAAYRSLVVDEPLFMTYFSEATPIDVIGRLRIGSRPASRRQMQGLADLRAIPWVFSWTQNRQMLPGWYGLGTGLQAAASRFGVDILRQMLAAWPFFQNMIADVEMVLAKADMKIGAHYAALSPSTSPRIWPRIEAEFGRTCAQVHAICDTQALLEREPVLRRAIFLRNPYVDPMSMLQVTLLPRWRAGGRSDLDVEKVLLTTIKGIARGLQN
ncbi:MAG: phosphoenolpyruvate carboxylase, partial [Oxalobacteraceae bacterium]